MTEGPKDQTIKWTGIPILLPCAVSKCRGFVLQQGVYDVIHGDTEDADVIERQDIPVRVLPDDALDALGDNRRRTSLENKFGKHLLNTDYDYLLALQARVDFHQYQSTMSPDAITAEERGLFAQISELAEIIPGRPLSESEKKFIDAGMKGSMWTRRYEPARFFGEVFGNQLQNARFVIWMTTEKLLAPGIFCPDLRTALVALIAVSLVHVKGYSVCKQCGKRFIRERRRMWYCSIACGNTLRKRRQRQREKRQTMEKQSDEE